MTYIRKYIQGRALTAGEVIDLVDQGHGYVYHRLWNRAVNIAFLKGIPARLLASYINNDHICDAIINPAWTAKKRGDNND